MPDAPVLVASPAPGPASPPDGLAGLQAAFAAAMAGRGDDALAAALASGNGPGPSTRLDIYRNNIASALVRSFEGLYPALVRLMGAGFFARVARDYARAHPPAHGRLLEYGFDLPEFVAGYEAAGRYPWLADVGRLELAWHRAYIAVEAPPLRASELAGVPPERMADLELVLHPSCQRLASRYPVSIIWRIALEDEEPETPVGFSAGSNGFPGFSPIAAGAWSRGNTALYGDVEVRGLDDAWTIGGALRLEDFEGLASRLCDSMSPTIPDAGIDLLAQLLDADGVGGLG